MKYATQILPICFSLFTLSSFQAHGADKAQNLSNQVKAAAVGQIKAATKISQVALTSTSSATKSNTPPKGFPLMKQYVGPGTSGGGNALVCFNHAQTVVEITQGPYRGYILDSHLSDINYIETFDLYEAKKPRGFSEQINQADIIQPAQDESLYEYNMRLLDRTKTLFPKFYDAVSRKLRDLGQHRAIVTEDRIDQVHDINPSVYVDKPNCMFATLAMQVKENDLITVYVDSQLFHHPLHSKLSKAVLYLHEAVYAVLRETNEFRNSDSRSTRYIVALLISRNVPAQNLEEALRAAGVRSEETYNGDLVIDSVTRKIVNAFEKYGDQAGLNSKAFNQVNNYNGSYDSLYKGEVMERAKALAAKMQIQVNAIAEKADFSELARELRAPQMNEILKEEFKNYFGVQIVNSCSGSSDNVCTSGIAGVKVKSYPFFELYARRLSTLIKTNVSQQYLKNNDGTDK